MKKSRRIILITALALCLSASTAWLYLRLNIRSVIIQMVTEQTNGAYRLDFKKLKTNYSTLTFTIEKGKLTALDTTSGQSKYFVEFPKVILQIRSLADILLNKQLHIHSISFENPSFNVLIQKSSKRTGFFQNMGDIYNYLNKFAEAANINNLQINNAKLILQDATRNNFTYHINNIHLHIKGFRPDSTNTPRHRVFLTDEIKLDVGKQNVILDSSKKIAFHGLHISTSTANLIMDSILYEGTKTDSTEPFRIYLPSLLLKRLNFAQLHEKGIVQVDSVMLDRPELDLSINLTPKQNTTKDLKHVMHDVVSHLFGDIDVHYLEMKNANTHLVTKLSKQERTIDVANHSLQLNDIYITAGDSGTVNLGDFSFSAKDYESFSTRNKYRMQFNQFNIQNGGDIILKNLSIFPTNSSTRPLLFLPKLTIDEADIGLLLVEKKIKARKFVLESAVIKHELKGLKEEESGKSLSDILRGIMLSADISELEFNNASYSVVRGGEKPLKFNADSLHLYFKFKDRRLSLHNSDDLLEALQNMSAHNLQFENPFYHLQAENMHYGEDKILKLFDFDFQRAPTRKITGKLLTISNPDIPVIVEDNKFIAQSLVISDANILHEGYSTIKMKLKQGFEMDLKNLVLNNIHLTSYERDDVKIAGDNISAVLQNVHKEKTTPVTFNIREAHAGNVTFSDSYLTAQASKISIVLGSLSTIENFSLKRKHTEDTLLVTSPTLYFQPSRFDINTKEVSLDHLFTDSAKVYAVFRNNRQNEPKQQAKNPWQLTLDQSRLVHVDVDVKKDNMHFVSPLTDIALESFNSIDRNIKGKINCQHYNYQINGESFSTNVNGNSLITSFTFVRQGEGENLLNIHSINTNGANVYLYRGSNHAPIVANDVSLTAGNLEWLTTETPLITDWISHEHLSFISIKKIVIPTAANNYTLHNIQYNAFENSLLAGSLLLTPLQSATRYFDSVGFQTDYITGNINGINILNPRFKLFTKEENITADKVSVSHFNLNIYRDKNYKQSGKFKPLPATLMKLSTLSLGIDTFSFSGGNICYTEVSDKTKKEGTVTFNNISGNAHRFNLKDTRRLDTFHVNAQGLLMNKGLFSLQYKTPLYNSSDKFTAYIQLDTFDLTLLNPVLEPLASANIRSGKVDEMSCFIDGDNFSGKGKMNFLYHDLAVEFLGNSNNNRKKNTSFLSRMKSFAANAFILRKKNTGKSGEIYFERIPQKFIFNYLVKLTFSGAMTSTGIKSNKSVQKQIDEPGRKDKISTTKKAED